MKRILIIAVLLILRYNASVAEYQTFDTFEKELYRYAINQSEELTSNLKDDQFVNHYMQFMDDKVHELLLNTSYAQPDYLIIMEPDDQFDLNGVLDNVNLQPGMASTLCFDVIFDTNSAHVDDAFAVWADRLSVYGLLPRTDEMPIMLYTILVYSDNGPQIVTAFYEIDSGMYMTKTCFVYNQYLTTNEIYAAFPYNAMCIWNNLDTSIIDLRNDD